MPLEKDNAEGNIDTSMLFQEDATDEMIAKTQFEKKDIELREEASDPEENLHEDDYSRKSKLSIDSFSGMMPLEKKKSEKQNDLSGLITLNSFSVEGLVSKSSIIHGKTTVYVKVNMGSTEKQTIPIRGVSDPTWEFETMDFMVKDNIYSSITFKLYQKDRIGTDKILGQTTVRVKDLKMSTNGTAGSIDREFILTGKGKSYKLKTKVTYQELKRTKDRL